MNRKTRAWPILLSIAAVSCSEPERPSSDAGRKDASAATQATQRSIEADPEPAGPPAPAKRLFAKRYVSRIRTQPKKEAPLLGYMRMGAVLSARSAEPIGYERCRKGWYELETGGFICSTQDAIPFDGERLPERRARQPDLSAKLPYPYGYSRAKNTPVYRRLPTDAEAARFEGYRPPGAPPPAPADAAADAGSDASAAAEAGDAGAPEKVPTLASLQGKEESVLVRRMERGFYVSLDREMRKGRRRYWRTQANGFIPHKRLWPVKGGDFVGVELDGESRRLPIGYVVSGRARAYRLNERGRLRRAAKPEYHHHFQPEGEVEVRGRRYVAAADGIHYRARDVVVIEPRDKPQEVAMDEKWIDVDLSRQSLTAYLGSRPVYVTLISSGRVIAPGKPLKDFATPTGSFRINAKHLTTTMEGDHAIDGPYSIEDVPYVMFFYQGGYALHSAFWHNSFGRPRSHGCVNLSPLDARFLFEWTEPQLPTRWHGVYTRGDQREGTRLYVHGETPRG